MCISAAVYPARPANYRSLAGGPSHGPPSSESVEPLARLRSQGGKVATVTAYHGVRVGLVRIIYRNGEPYWDNAADVPGAPKWSPVPRYDWGFGGYGPALLSRALLLDTTGLPDVADRYYEDFKWQVVSRWGREWTVTSQEILSWLARQQERERLG